MSSVRPLPPSDHQGPDPGRAVEEERFRRIFRRLHAHHDGCVDDEWLSEPCRDAGGGLADRPIVWSRRNGPWRRIEILWVGAAPGNAGGKGDGDRGAHGTRIPFGGDVAGANLDVLFAGIGLDRNETFITAALNQLPERGGGEPKVAELKAPTGEYPSSIHLLHDTIVAAGPRLIVALGNVALRTAVAAARLDEEPLQLPGLERLRRAGLERGAATPWPEAEPPGERFRAAWREAWDQDPPPRLLWLTHPSAQNMSPYAGTETAFHRRMVRASAALRRTVRDVLDRPVPDARPRVPATGPGVYSLPEWREVIRPRNEELAGLWREKGV